MRRVGLAALLMVWASLTAARVEDWQSDRALWTAAIRVTPQQPSPWVMLGIAEMQRECAVSAAHDLTHAQELLERRPAKARDFIRTLVYFWADRAAGFSAQVC